MDIVKFREEIISEIINDFDFDEVEKVMKFLNWHYYKGHVPTVCELIKLSTRLLRDAFDGLCLHDAGTYRVESGGFEASMWRVENGIDGRLSFILTYYDVHKSY